MYNVSMAELGIILVIALVVFGPGKLPEVGRSLGKSIDEFKQALASKPVKEETVTIQSVSSEKKNDEII